MLRFALRTGVGALIVLMTPALGCGSGSSLARPAPRRLVDALGMTETSTNLVSGTLTGTIASNNMATGTLTASWSAPGAGCVSGDAPNPCAQGAIKMTFHVTLP